MNTLKAILVVASICLYSCDNHIPERIKDNANILSGKDRSIIDKRLDAYQRGSGYQMLVYTISETAGITSVDNYAEELVKRIDFGETGFSKSIVMFIFMKENYAKFRWGSNVNGLISENIAEEIIKKAGEHFSQGDFRTGILTAIEEVGKLKPSIKYQNLGYNQRCNNYKYE